MCPQGQGHQDTALRTSQISLDTGNMGRVALHMGRVPNSVVEIIFHDTVIVVKKVIQHKSQYILGVDIVPHHT